MIFLAIFLLATIASGFFMALAFMQGFWLLFGLLVAIDISIIIYAVVDYGRWYDKREAQTKALRQAKCYDIIEPQIYDDPKNHRWLVKRMVAVTESYSSEKIARERKALIKTHVEETVFTNKRCDNGKDDL